MTSFEEFGRIGRGVVFRPAVCEITSNLSEKVLEIRGKRGALVAYGGVAAVLAARRRRVEPAVESDDLAELRRDLRLEHVLPGRAAPR